MNDNTPHFNVDSPNIDNLQVAENRPVGELVLKSEAVDADEGSNGKVSNAVVYMRRFARFGNICTI